NIDVEKPMVTSRFKQKARPGNTSNETKDQLQGKFFHPNDKNEATRSNVKSSKITSLRLLSNGTRLTI
ncbi:hypothetical protein, partial [Vibrio sp. 1978]|uniref:hypothetical protein n=1 Tax=Vibrio sp. 1978 TaxID=3074585 RepID=UPI00296690F8